MKLRLRLWWDVMPFMAKAALIVLVMGLAVTASAHAATLGEDQIGSASAATHHARTNAPTDTSSASRFAVRSAPVRHTSVRTAALHAVSVVVSTSHTSAASARAHPPVTASRRSAPSPAHMVGSTRSRVAVTAGSVAHVVPPRIITSRWIKNSR